MDGDRFVLMREAQLDMGLEQLMQNVDSDEVEWFPHCVHCGDVLQCSPLLGSGYLKNKSE